MVKRFFIILSSLSIFCVSLSFSAFSSGTVASAAELDFNSATSYSLSSWDSAPDDLISLADSYVSYCSDIYSSRSQISLDWIYTVGSTFCISPRSGLFYFLEDGSLYRYTDSSIAHSSGGGSHSGGSHSAGVTLVSSSDSVEVDSSTFKDYITNENFKYTPKNSLAGQFKTSIFNTSLRNSSAPSQKKTSYYLYRDGYPLVSSDSFGGEKFDELFIVPYFCDSSGAFFYSRYLLHTYFSYDLSLDGYTASFNVDYINNCSDVAGDVLVHKSYDSSVFSTSSDALNSLKSSIILGYNDWNYDSVSSPYYFSFLPVQLGFSSYYDLSFSDFSIFFTTSDVNSSLVGYFDSDGQLVDLPHSASNSCYRVFDCDESIDYDYGLLVSSSYIDFKYRDIETTKIPDNQIISISGDTIYDYSITNPDTGESTTVNNYITNNYTYPEGSGSGDTSGSSGGASTGDVNVGGNVIVGGEVGINGSVDININISGGGGSAGDIISDVDGALSDYDTDFNAYYDDALEKSDGFRQFLSKFFEFVPAPILGLLTLGVVVCIVCRVLGR